MMFVDEVRKQMPQHSILDQRKEDIMNMAKYGCRHYAIRRISQDMELAEELEWFKNEGFKVREYEAAKENDYYPPVSISW